MNEIPKRILEKLKKYDLENIKPNELNIKDYTKNTKLKE